MRHPRRAVGLLERGRPPAAAPSGRSARCCRARGSRPRTRCCPSASLRFTHQVKFISSLWNTRARNARSRAAVDLEHPQRSPGVHRRVDVAERPLVGRDLPVRVHVPLAQHQQELLLGEAGVDVRQSHAVERQVPRGVPGVLPRVRHRDHVARCRGVATRRCAREPLQGRRRPGRVALEPARRRRGVELLAPHRARPPPAAAPRLVGAGRRRRQRREELVGLGLRAPPRPRRTRRPGAIGSPPARPAVSRSRISATPPAGTVST